jgi:aryl-alcohol dehydrogenase-like predicted oxidoreductase
MDASGLERRTLGDSELSVGAVGLGCMGMSHSYGHADESEAVATIHRALEIGVTLLDTANVYGNGHNETLVGRALQGQRDIAVLATKFGLRNVPGGQEIDARPEDVKGYCEESLKRLGTDYIDLYYLHRIDRRYPIEEVVGAMAELVREGKVKYLGLCEGSSASLERAARVHPLAALQSEWSLWTRDLEADVLGTARRLRIGIVPFCPLGRGYLTGAVADDSMFDPTDVRYSKPRFQQDVMPQNRALVEQIGEVAREAGCTPAQLLLAWLLHQGTDVVPIPGTKRRSYLEENAAADEIVLSPAVVARLSALTADGQVHGGRYANAAYTYGDSPVPQ